MLAAEINILPESDRPRCRAPSGTAGHVERREQSQSRGGERRDKAGGDLKQGRMVESGRGTKTQGWTQNGHRATDRRNDRRAAGSEEAT